MWFKNARAYVGVTFCISPILLTSASKMTIDLDSLDRMYAAWGNGLDTMTSNFEHLVKLLTQLYPLTGTGVNTQAPTLEDLIQNTINGIRAADQQTQNVPGATDVLDDLRDALRAIRSATVVIQSDCWTTRVGPEVERNVWDVIRELGDYFLYSNPDALENDRELLGWFMNADIDAITGTATIAPDEGIGIFDNFDKIQGVLQRVNDKAMDLVWKYNALAENAGYHDTVDDTFFDAYSDVNVFVDEYNELCEAILGKST
ncbi:hypothetical protein ABW19_dt0206140 [Dactylella cylindrospora]|nr:hypothetical protein ABW19_dt0206140 [Dactylella cylindrospora]